MPTETGNEIGPVIAVKGARIVPALILDGQGFLDVAQMRQFTGRCDRALRDWRNQGYGPPHMFVGRTVYYPVADALAWMGRGGKRGPGRPKKARRS